MSSKRKTIEVEAVKQTANTFLAAPDSFTHGDIDPKSQRLGVIGLLETTLHATGNYRGFTYQASELVADGSGASYLKDDYDESRRRYI